MNYPILSSSKLEKSCQTEKGQPSECTNCICDSLTALQYGEYVTIFTHTVQRHRHAQGRHATLLELLLEESLSTRTHRPT